MTDESERWLRSSWQSSVKNRWPHGQGKASEPPKLSGVRRSSSSDSQDGGGSERLHRHTKSRTGEVSGRVGAGSTAVVPAQVETTQSSTRPRTSPQVQQIPQATTVLVTPRPPAETQPSTTQPFIGGKPSTTQTSFRTTSTYVQPSKLNPVFLTSKAHSTSHAEVCVFPYIYVCYWPACEACGQLILNYFAFSASVYISVCASALIKCSIIVTYIVAMWPYFSRLWQFWQLLCVATCMSSLA